MSISKRSIYPVLITFGCIISIIHLVGCSDHTERGPNPCAQRVEKLTDRKLQWKFLDSIGKSDQHVRNVEITAVQLHGYDSKEHKEALAQMIQTDASNLDCIEAYLARHGHPTHQDHGIDASSVPGTVIHHSSGGVDSRLRNFKYLYWGYLNRGVFEDDLIMILNRAYQIKFGERIEWNRPFRSEEELDTLIVSLGLREEVAKIRMEEGYPE